MSAEVGVTTNHRDEVAELLAGYRRSREQLASVQRALAAISESASSADGLVTASVDSAGSLAALRIADTAYQRYRPAELADLIVHAARTAAVRAGARARQALAPVLPPAADPSAALAGTADLTAGEIHPSAPAGRTDDEETYEHRSWLGRDDRGST